jgi:hypothetical protein
MGQLAERQRPVRREEYERMIGAGFFRGERIELIHGVIVEISPQNAPHADVIQALTRLLLPPRVGETIQPLAFADVSVSVEAVFGA